MQLSTALRAVECHLALSPMPTLNASLFECASGLRCVDAALGKGLLQIVMVIATLERPSWLLVGRVPEADKWARHLHCPDRVDAWTCMHGRVEPAEVARGCSAEQAASGRAAAAANRTLVALVVMRNLLLRGARLSPLLEPGAAPPPPPPPPPTSALRARGGPQQSSNVSVAVRGGDACDVVEHVPLSPRYFQGTWDPVIRTSWSRQRRHCAHADVYVEMLRARLPSLLPRGAALDTILLATDDHDAAARLPAALAAATTPFGARIDAPPRVWVRPFDRMQLAHGRLVGPRARTMRQWVEHRRGLNADVATSVLEDLRLLARGAALVASLCSSLATLAWNLIVAARGEEVPFASVDGCLPHLEVLPRHRGTTNDERERRGLPTYTAEVHRGGPEWRGVRSSWYPRYVGDTAVPVSARR